MNQLPILAHASAIRAAVRDHRRLILSAPPGTGKSTQVPQILWPESGRAVVLQPRRIATRSLAMRVASERGEEVGSSVGFQVRFEKSRQADTKVLFATYGVFFQQLLQDPLIPDVSLVILDEFHERTLEADACLAWLRQLQKTRKDLSLVVMSATLEGSKLAEYLEHPPFIEVETRAHAVEIHYQSQQPQEPVWAQAVRGFRHLWSLGQTGSVLIFMPGVGEIRRTAEALEPVCRPWGFQVLELSGAQTPEAQQKALSLPSQTPCVIVATNIAETSLTIPGVTAVIDSGLARHASYDVERDVNTLQLGLISRQSATQRAGRAGRLAPGTCLRLWPKTHETSMKEAFSPEIERLDLGQLALAMAALPETPPWLTPPPLERYEQALSRLAELEALDSRGCITPLGRKLLRYPLPPALARVLLAGQETGHATLCAAMIALLENGDRRLLADEGDLYLLGLSLVRDPNARQWSRDVKETFQQLLRLARPTEADAKGAEDRCAPDSVEELARRRSLTACWLESFSRRLAFRQDKAFHLADGRKGMVSAGTPTSSLLIALELHESGGSGQNRQVKIPLYLPCEAGWLPHEGQATIVCEWDDERQRVFQERQWKLGGLTLKREALAPRDWDRGLMEALLVEKLLSGEAKLEAYDTEVEQLVLRIKLASKIWPEAKFPALDDEDWTLLYHELCQGVSSLSGIKQADLVELLREYVGWEGMMRIDREAPRSLKLQNGRNGRFTYFDDAPPELAARLGDMLGLQGTMHLCEGRVQVLFDILAPNMRTVQKTFDLTGFWQNTYPEVRRELQRRYPKHPWP